MVKTKFIQTRQGFSILEILVALSLIGLVFAMGANVNFTYRQALEEVVQNIERGVRLGVSEATIRNTIIRLHFDLSKSPQKWSLQYGPDASFVLPDKAFQTLEGLSLKETEEFIEENKKFNKKFNRIPEFKDGARDLEPDIKIVAYGSEHLENLVLDFEASLYIYPTGEKDSAIIILASPDEMIAITVEAFTQNIEREYVTLPEGDEDDLIERQLDKAQELFEKWKKDRS